MKAYPQEGSQLRRLFLALFMFLHPFSSMAAEVEVLDKTVSAEAPGEVKAEVRLAARIPIDELQGHSNKIYEDVGRPKKLWIGYYVPDSKTVWALTLRNFGSVEPHEVDQLITRIAGFSLEEWESFGKVGRLHPTEAKVVGIWDFPFASVSGAEVAIYAWQGEDFVYTRYKSDGSGIPQRVTSKRHRDGRKFLELYDDDHNFWLLKKDGALERHEGGKLVEGWHGPKLAEATQTKTAGTSCAVVSGVKREAQKFDDSKVSKRVSTIEIAILTDITDKTDALSVAQDIVKQLESHNATDVEIGFYHHKEAKSWKNRSPDILISYTPDPTQLVYRDAIWSLAGNAVDPDLLAQARPRSLCNVGALSR